MMIIANNINMIVISKFETITKCSMSVLPLTFTNDDWNAILNQKTSVRVKTINYYYR